MRRPSSCLVRRCAAVVGAWALLALISAPGAIAQNSTADIQSAGPLTDIFISSDTECQVAHTGDVDANGNPQFEFFPPEDSTGVSCGTEVSIAGQLFGPLGSNAWSEQPQSGVSGLAFG